MAADDSSGASGAEPQDPMTEMGTMAAHIAELFKAHVEAGMPPVMVAVMLGQLIAASGAQGQAPE